MGSVVPRWSGAIWHWFMYTKQMISMVSVCLTLLFILTQIGFALGNFFVCVYYYFNIHMHVFHLCQQFTAYSLVGLVGSATQFPFPFLLSLLPDASGVSVFSPLYSNFNPQPDDRSMENSHFEWHYPWFNIQMNSFWLQIQSRQPSFVIYPKLHVTRNPMQSVQLAQLVRLLNRPARAVKEPITKEMAGGRVCERNKVVQNFIFTPQW